MTTVLLACGSTGALAPVAGVTLVVDTTLYEVAGRTPREWRVSLRENGQKATGTSYSAFTRWNVRYEYRTRLRHLVTPACDSYGTVAARMWAAISRKYTALQVAYDERTRHGITQGAVLPSADVIRFAIDTTAKDTLP